MSDIDETWESASVDPDPVTDLGYEHTPLTAIHVDDDRFVFLPGEEDHLTDAEFLVVEPDDVCTLSEWR